MKKIMHHLNFDAVGGVEQLFFHFLEKSGLCNMLLVKNKAIHPFFKEAKLQTRDYVKYAGPLKLPSFLRNWNAKRLIKKRDPELVVSWNCMRAAKNIAAKQVYYDHGLAWFEEGEVFGKELRSFDALLSCCEASKRVMQLKWGNDLNVKVLPNPSLFSAKAPRKYPENKTFCLGLVGRLTSFKAQHVVLHALESLSDLPIVLKIAGTGKLLPSLKKSAKALGILDRVQFLGDVRDMQSFYQTIDLFVSPSIREPYALVVLEAMAHALPLVISDIDGLPKAVKDSKAGVCIQPTLALQELEVMGGCVEKMPKYVYNPLEDALQEPKVMDPEFLAKHIRAILSEKDLYETLSQNAANYAKEHLGFESYQKRLEEALQAG